MYTSAIIVRASAKHKSYCPNLTVEPCETTTHSLAMKVVHVARMVGGGYTMLVREIFSFCVSVCEMLFEWP